MRVLTILLLFGLCTMAQGEETTYEWLDAQGVMHFTDNPDSVPTKYQKKIKIRKSGKDSGAIQQAPVKGMTVVPPAPLIVRDYGGHDEGWWRSNFIALRQELTALQEALPGKNEKLMTLHRKRVIYQRSSDRSLYNNQKAEIERDEARIAELQNALSTLDADANRAGVPVDWRK